MTKYRKWLISELGLWVSDGIISTNQAETIKARYAERVDEIEWSKIIFLCAGAILVGLGVILFFAYNWHAIPKFGKLTIILSSLLFVHLAGMIVRQIRSGIYTAVSEGMHLLGTMLFGAGIFLVAQIYHINEHYPNAFLIWSIGAVLLAWIMPSVGQAIVSSVLFVIWNACEVSGFSNPNYFAPFVQLVAILPLAWTVRSRLLLSIGIISSFLMLLFTIFVFEHHSWAFILGFDAAICIGIGLLIKRNKTFEKGSPIFIFLGTVLYLISIYILSFPQHGENHYVSTNSKWQETAYLTGFGLSASAVWFMAIFTSLRIPQGMKRLSEKGLILVPIFVCIAVIQLLFPSYFQGWGKALFFNIIFLVYALLLVLKGSKTMELKTAISGCLLMGALVFTRYIDLFESLLVRACLFFFVGAALFGVGIYYSLSKKRQRRF